MPEAVASPESESNYWGLAPKAQIALSRYAVRADAGASLEEQVDDLSVAVRAAKEAHSEIGEAGALLMTIGAILYVRDPGALDGRDTFRLVMALRDQFPDGRDELIRRAHPPVDNTNE